MIATRATRQISRSRIFPDKQIYETSRPYINVVKYNYLSAQLYAVQYTHTGKIIATFDDLQIARNFADNFLN